MKTFSNNLNGTYIRIGNDKRNIINKMIDILLLENFEEISIPILQKTEVFKNKVGEENNNMMYNFKDNGNRELTLAPEYTAVIQSLALNRFKYEKDLKLFYIQECFRGERPQKGRYRQFTQFGVEIINPNKTKLEDVINLSEKLIKVVTEKYKLHLDSKRGLDYYIDGKGFEIHVPELNSCSQICGGGFYKGGVGFAIGIDRLMLI